MTLKIPNSVNRNLTIERGKVLFKTLKSLILTVIFLEFCLKTKLIYNEPYTII